MPKGEEKDLTTWLASQLASDAGFNEEVERQLKALQIGFKITTARGRLSQAEMSRVARVSQGFLSKLERDANLNPELRTLVRAATALGLRLKVEFEAEQKSRKKRSKRKPEQ